MILKLSVRNAKRQMQEYLIYFITLTIVSSLMFGFNLLIYSDAVREVATLVAVAPLTIIAASIFIVIILAWLVGYMMNFMLKKRSKELSIYMVLGIETKKIVYMFLIENLLIGILSLVVGFVIGGFVYQVLCAVIMNLVGRQYVLVVSFSFEAAGLTALYFAAIYFLALWRSNRKIRKMKLYDLLYYNKQNEETIVKTKYQGFIIFCLSILSLGFGLFLYIVTPVGDGIDIVFGTIFFMLFLYGIFTSLPSVLSTALANNLKWKYKGNHMVLLRNFTSKINSISITMATLSALFTLSLFLISIGMIYSAILEQRAALVPFDLTIIDENGSADFSKYQEYLESTVGITEQHIYPIYKSGSTEYSQRFQYQLPYFTYDGNGVGEDMYMSYSDYRQLRDMLGLEQVSMDNSTFLVHSLSYAEFEIQAYFTQNPTMSVKGSVLCYGGIHTERFDQYDGMPNGDIFIFIVPDDVADTLFLQYIRYSVLTASPIQNEQYESLFSQFSALRPFRTSETSYPNGTQKESRLYVDAKIAVQENNGYVYTIYILPLLYLAFVVCVTGITVLASHILSDEGQQQQQIVTLKNVGYNRKQIDYIILGKLALLFLVPVVPPIILSSTMTLIWARGVKAHIFVTSSQLWQNIIIAHIIFLLIYLVYYILTNIIYRKNVM